MMTRTFWAGFGVAVIVILLPVLLLIDARSSVDQHPDSGRKGKRPEGSNQVLLSGESESAPFPSLPPASSLPESHQGAHFEDDISKKHLSNSPYSKSELERPEIVFSPERVRRSIAHDPRRKTTSGAPPHPPQTGIRTIVYDPTHVYTVRTAVSHVTLIDLPEEAKEVYLGDSKLFLAEVFGSRVKIKPITWDPSITTNMIIYTLHHQFAFRLLVVTSGEDDLLTFYLPKSGTVVNLNPIRTKIEQDLAVREKVDLRKQELVTLRSAGASDPVEIWKEKEGVRVDFLGFSSLGKDRYALFEVSNKTTHPLTLSGIRLRRFRTSLFWEGKREWFDGEDWSRGFHLVVSPNSSQRVLLPADPPPLSSKREGYYAELRLDRESGGRQVIDLETRGRGK